jgi:transglutaminase-like putative cysteine protease
MNHSICLHNEVAISSCPAGGSRAFLRTSFFLALSLALAASCLTARAAGYDGSRWSFLDTAKVLESAKEITTTKYPDSDAATVDKKMVRVYRPDGTGEAQDETYTKALTEKGKRGNRDLSLFFMLPYFKVEVVKLEVIKPGGERIAVDVAANSKEMIDDSQMVMNIYDPNNKILKVNIPQLEVGDIVHSIVRTTTERAIIAGEYADENVFEESGLIRHLTYDIYEPGEKPLKHIVLRDEVPGTLKHSVEKQEGNVALHHWEVSDVPRMFGEPSMPPASEVLQRLLVSTTTDWQSISKWYYGVCRPHLDATTPEMKKTVADLTAGAKGDLERVKAVFYHVAQKIRYMGITPEKDRPGFEPHDVKLTFDNQYGVCRDKAALLVSLLEAAGFKTYPVLINVGTKLDPEVPSPDFNHAIVAVELKKGEYTLMDPTAENTKDLLPSYECDQSYLICRPEGEMLKLSPIIPASQNLLRVQTTATLDAKGTLQGKSEIAFDGINDNAYREAFSRMKPDDKRRFFERSLKSAMPGARLVSLSVLPEDTMDVSIPLQARMEFTASGMTAAGNGKAVVRLPWISKGMGVVNFVLGGTGLEKRKYPLRTGIACGVTEHISIKLAEVYTGQISMPGYPPIEDKSLTYRRRVQLDGSTLACSSEFNLEAVEFSPSQYLELKRSLKALDYDERKAPVLAVSSAAIARDDDTPRPAAKSDVESNARIVESHKELTITSAHAAVLHGRYVKQVLTYGGKKSEAEVKLNYNPSCEDAKIVKAVVTTKAGVRKEIAAQEINVMDAGWNASAKRYTGGKILVANLPGVDLGCTIEVEYELTSKGKPFISGFEPFQTFDDLEKKQFRLTVPAGVNVQTVVTGPTGIVHAISAEAGGNRTYGWEAQKVAALPAESQLPPDWAFLAGVDYFAGDMTNYLAELNSTLLDRAGKSAKAAEVAKRLVAEAKDKKDGVKAIRDFVTKNIRHAGPSFADLPLSELSAADTTLTDGYGHTADRAILLHAMLSAAGYAPEFVLASGLPPVSGITNLLMSFPQPQNFQNPLVRVTLDGAAVYLNDTDQYAELGTTPSDGRVAIALATQGFEVIHAAKDCRDKTETDYTLSLSDSGKTRVGITRRFFGNTFNSQNRYFSELPPEERRRYYQELVSGVAQGAQPVGELETKFDSYPGTEQFTVEVDHYSVVDGKYSYLDLPYTPSLFYLGADSRTLPLYLSHGHQQTVRTHVNLPAGFRKVAIAPVSQSLSAPDGAGNIRITSTEEDGQRVIVHEMETRPAIVSAEDYPAMLKLETTLGRKDSKTLLLESSDRSPILP